MSSRDAFNDVAFVKKLVIYLDHPAFEVRDESASNEELCSSILYYSEFHGGALSPSSNYNSKNALRFFSLARALKDFNNFVLDDQNDESVLREVNFNGFRFLYINLESFRENCCMSKVKVHDTTESFIYVKAVVCVRTIEQGENNVTSVCTGPSLCYAHQLYNLTHGEIAKRIIGCLIDLRSSFAFEESNVQVDSFNCFYELIKMLRRKRQIRERFTEVDLSTATETTESVRQELILLEKVIDSFSFLQLFRSEIKIFYDAIIQHQNSFFLHSSKLPQRTLTSGYSWLHGFQRGEIIRDNQGPSPSKTSCVEISKASSRIFHQLMFEPVPQIDQLAIALLENNLIVSAQFTNPIYDYDIIHKIYDYMNWGYSHNEFRSTSLHEDKVIPSSTTFTFRNLFRANNTSESESDTLRIEHASETGFLSNPSLGITELCHKSSSQAWLLPLFVEGTCNHFAAIYKISNLHSVLLIFEEQGGDNKFNPIEVFLGKVEEVLSSELTIPRFHHYRMQRLMKMKGEFFFNSSILTAEMISKLPCFHVIGDCGDMHNKIGFIFDEISSCFEVDDKIVYCVRGDAFIMGWYSQNRYFFLLVEDDNCTSSHIVKFYECSKSSSGKLQK